MHFLVTAGPTREHIDPVRFLSNRSTGRMGFAVAAAALEMGHRATLVAGPVSLAAPSGARRIDVVSALEMQKAVQENLPDADALVMTAAVADFRPKSASAEKLKKSAMPKVLELVPNPDILGSIAPLKGNRIFMGFAAETGFPEAEALRKLSSKGLDFICANDVTKEGAGFAIDTNIVTVYGKDGFREDIPLMSKTDIARRLVAIIERASSAGASH